MKKLNTFIFIPIILLLFLILIGCDLMSLNPFNSSDFTRTPQNLLFVVESDYSSSNDYPMVDMVFDSPSTIGATKYTLQQYDANNEIWENFQYFGEDVETTETINDNFSLNLNKDSKIRLLITGGEYDNQTSNEIYVELSDIDTYFQAFSINTNSTYFGIEEEYSGESVIANFTVKKNLPDNTVVENALNYQWYRIDPNDFEKIELIEGAISNEYIPTNADKNYILMIRASGDGINAGGYCQLLGPYIQ